MIKNDDEFAKNLTIGMTLDDISLSEISFFFNSEDEALEGLGHFFYELTKEKHYVAECLLTLQNKLLGPALFQEVKKQSQDEKNHFLDKQVKLLKKVGDHLANLHRVANPQVEWGKHLFDRLTFKYDH
ncbi:ferritin light chain-like [Orycteropus afer afer]|uniref:Ferritin light chain-like n=1 Tax=Orycteropus afer afer TaxID=1230840 RepID=A0AC54Z972_ORYAF|nr:ferritin light chain-like [Orycteropus afer afer]